MEMSLIIFKTKEQERDNECFKLTDRVQNLAQTKVSVSIDTLDLSHLFWKLNFNSPDIAFYMTVGVRDSSCS